MFQRIKGAIDRTIAEEQARQRGAESGSPSRSSSASRRGEPATRRPRPRASPDIGDSAAVNPDPAVFEAAFALDDGEEAEPSATAKPAATEGDEFANKEPSSKKPDMKDASDEPSGANEGERSDNNNKGAMQDAAERTATPSTPAPNLPPEIRARLRKLEKLESTYPELLRSYRVAHKRATSIEPFEKALREHTPLTSIGDPEAMVEYLMQLKVKGDMVMDELKRVSADKDELKKSNDRNEKKYKSLQEQLDALKAANPIDNIVDANMDTSDSDVVAAKGAEQDAAGPSKSRTSQDLFSYDEEIPALQADLSAKTEEVSSLKLELANVSKHSADLAVSLENSALEISHLREAAAADMALKSQLETRDAELTSLTGQLDKANYQVRELEKRLQEEQSTHASTMEDITASLTTSEKRSSKLDAELAAVAAAKASSEGLVGTLNVQIETLKREKAASQCKIDELTQKLGAGSMPTTQALAQSGPSTSAPQPSAQATGGGKKKNKKRKAKSGAAAAQASVLEEFVASEVASEPQQGSDASGLEASIARLREEIADKDLQIERLSKRRKNEEDLREEIETLQENLLNIGQDHVEDKQMIKELQEEKKELKSAIDTLEIQMSSMSSSTEAIARLQSEKDALRKEYEEIKDKAAVLQSDLGAAQLLAQARFNNMTDLRETLQRLQPEIKNLRQESAALKSTKEELAAKMKALRELELKEKELKRDLTQAQSTVSDRDREIKLLQEKVTTETNAKLRLEEQQRSAARDSRRSEAERLELSSKIQKTERELEKVKEEAGKLRPRVKELEDLVHKLKQEAAEATEEAEFKTQQYASVQGLLTSMRDEAAEMAVQLKESRSRAESLEEEMARVQQLMQERTHETETMRRLLADVDVRSAAQVNEMRSKLEAAVEERDRVEDESSTLARRKTRETEEIKQKLRALERENKSLGDENEELKQRKTELEQRQQDDEMAHSKAETESDDLRLTLSQLQKALQASEDQARDSERQRDELRTAVADYRARCNRLDTELKAAKSRLAGPLAGPSSSRVSSESTRGGSNVNGAATPDTMYLKTILLQFLEQKDVKLRAQLVPVLGKLLKFDKDDEKKWLAVVQQIGSR